MVGASGLAWHTARSRVCDLLPPLPVTRSIRLRPWQKAAFEKYVAAGQADFLTVATPGAGKTTFALTVARHVGDPDAVHCEVELS